MKCNLLRQRYLSCQGIRRLSAALMVAVVLQVTAGPSWAGEEPERFLKELRLINYHDVVLDYLEQARTNPLVSTEFKATIDYERGITLLLTSRMVPSSQREERLDGAQQSFEKFLAAHPGHPLVSDANTQLANSLIERGKFKIEIASADDKPDAEKQRLRGEARALYEAAQKAYAKLEAHFRAEIQKYPKGVMDEKKEAAQIELRQQARGGLVDSLLGQAQIVEEMSKTHEPGSTENKRLMADAAKAYGGVYDKYGGYGGGLYARLYQGRCFKELGQFNDVFGACEDLMQLDGDDPFIRRIKNRAMLLFLETGLIPDAKKLAESIAQYAAWEKWARPNEEESEDGLAVKYFGAKLMLQYARSLTERKDVTTRTENLRKAKMLFVVVSNTDGEYQRLARAELRSSEFTGVAASEETPPPADFVEATQQAKEALGRAIDPELPPEDAAKLRAEAIDKLHAAMRMRTPETTADEMNYLRYYLAYLYWVNGDLYEAAVAGEFLARKYPGSSGARDGAKIAMAAYAILLSEVPKGEDRKFESQRMDSIADHITQVWAGEPEADEAWIMRTRMAVLDQDIDKALEYLQQISEKSPRRGEAALMVGQTLWSNHVNKSRLPEGERPSDAELQKIAAQAHTALQEGVDRMRTVVEQGGDVTYSTVIGVLSLAQAAIRAGEPEKAVLLLEDPKIGALTLVNANHPVIPAGNVPQEIYKAALRAYVASRQVDQAKTVMEKLEQSVGEGGEAKLTTIYLGLGKQLKESLAQYRAEGKDQEATELAEAFVDFLMRIAGREQGNTFRSLGWVAETLYTLGSELDPPGKELPEAAKQCFTESANAYRRILEQCKADETFAPKPGVDLMIKVRLARCLRSLGEFNEAMDLLVEVIEAKPTAISAQIEAAYTYQEWGEVKSTYYAYAIAGGRPNKETKIPRVWGWVKIGNRVVRNPSYIKTFHEARYNIALCRFESALGESSEKKGQLLTQAEKDILDVFRLYPEMGGSDWFPKYDKLLKTIQKLRNKTPTGLKRTTTKKAS